MALLVGITLALVCLIAGRRHLRLLLSFKRIALPLLFIIPLGEAAQATEKSQATRRVIVDLYRYWYGGKDPLTGKSRRHEQQERFIFGPHRPDGCPGFQGALAGRRWGKTVALVRKAIVLLLLNPGTPEDPVWGGVYGRTRREAEKRIIKPLLGELRKIRRDLGLDLTPKWDKQNQEIHLANGSALYIGSYGKNDSLENQRGDTLGWAIVDEIERSFVPTEDILAVIVPAISDHRARHSCLVWASSPNGLRGMPLKHHEAFQKRDPDFFLVVGTIYDNPFLKPSQIETIKGGLSKRMWLQEGMGICLAPSNVVFVEFDERKHVIDYEWDPSDLSVVSIDWGTSHGYMAVMKVNPFGRWVVAMERKVTEVSPLQFRHEVREFIDIVRDRDHGRIPYLITCDGAVKDERKWLDASYGQDTQVRWLKKDAEQGIGWGINLISFMLDPAQDATAPDARGTMLFLSRDLDPTTDKDRMGIRGAFVSYTYARQRDEDGDLIATNTPNKKNSADHPIDVLRYALCKSRRDEPLHGGRVLPFIDPELDRMRAQRTLSRYGRTYDEAA
jgi:hypothetical protein